MRIFQSNISLLLGVALLISSESWALDPSQVSNVTDVTTNQVVATIPVGSEPNNVIVSPDNSTVYVANKASNTVSVINAALIQ